MSEENDTPVEESLEELAEEELEGDDEAGDDDLEGDGAAETFETDSDSDDDDDDVETPARPDEDDDDDDDDDELEADLDAILKVRIAAGDDDDDDDEDKPPVKKETPPGEAEHVQAKQDHEFLCPACFLLVNSTSVTNNECPHCGEPLGDMS